MSCYMIETSLVLSSEIFGKCSETFVSPPEQFWKIFENLWKEAGNLPQIVENVVIRMLI